MTEPWRLSLAELSAALAKGDLGAGELLESVLGHLDRIEPAVHAWASVDVAGARASARAADAEIAAGRHLGPLHGIPVGIKDVIDTAGWPTEAGSRVLRGRVPRKDAAVVTALRAAGAVLLGKTVTHEFACGQGEPPTRSPWDPERYPGGSSAGSGVAVATGSAVVAIGTDTGGSIRNPASVNGIVGLKPTGGLLGTEGVVPVSRALDRVGPLTRSVTDCALALDALLGRPGPRSGYAAALEEDATGLRIGVDTEWWAGCGVPPETIEAVMESLRRLVEPDGELVPVRLPSLDLALPAGLVASVCETAAWHHRLLRERGADYERGTRVMLTLGALIPGEDLVVAQQVCDRVRREVRAAFGRHRLTLLAGPTLPGVAPPLATLTSDFTDDAGESSGLAGAVGLLIPANVADLPAISVPRAPGRDGLPVGLQLIGRPYAEAIVLRAARRQELRYDATALWPRPLDPCQIDVSSP